MIFSSTIIAHFLFPFNQRCSIQLFPPVLPFTQPIRKILSKHGVLSKARQRWWVFMPPVVGGRCVSGSSTKDPTKKLLTRNGKTVLRKEGSGLDVVSSWKYFAVKKDFDYFEIIQFTEIPGMRMRERHWLISDCDIWNVEGWHLAKASVKDHSSPCSHDAKAINP